MPLGTTDHFFETILQYLQGDIAVLDTSFRYIYVNPYAIRDAEIRSWIIGKTDLEYCLFRGLDPELAHRRRDMFRKSVETGKLVEWEERITTHEGMDRVFLRRVFPVVNEQKNEVTYLIGHGLDITDRRKVRDELETNRRFLDTVLNSSPNLIFVKDAQGRFLMANKAVADSFNLTPEALILKSNAEVHKNKDELDVYAQADAEVIRTGKAVRLEESFTRLDGQKFWYDTIKVPLVEKDGVVNVLGISIDITERKEKEELLRLSEQHLAEAQELTRSGNWIRHLKDDSVEWSSGLFKIWERDPAMGQPSPDEVMEYVYPADRDLIYRMIGEVLETATPRDFKYRVIVNGEVRYIRSFAKAVCDHQGNVIDIFGSVIDISDQVETERKLRENEMRLTEAQKLAKMGSYELDLITGKITYSPAAYLLYEWDPDEPAPDAREFQNALFKEDLPYFEELWTKLPERRDTFETLFRFLTKSGKVKHIRVVNLPIRDEDDNLVRVVGTIADITDLKETEEKLLRNEQRLNEAQQMARMGSFTLDLITGHIEWSQGMYLIWGIDEAEEITFEKILSRVHPEDIGFVEQDYHDIKFRTEPWQLVHRIITREGKVKFIELFFKIVMQDDGRQKSMVGSCIDITEKKEIEEKLRLNEQRLFEAQELSRSGSWELFLLPEYRLEWTPGTYKIWDLAQNRTPPSRDEFYDRVIPADRDKVQEAFRILLQEKRPAEVQYRVWSYALQEKVFFSRGVPVKNAAGEVYKVYGTTADVTERVQREQRLSDNEQSLLQAQRLAKLGSWYLNLRENQFEWAEGMYYIWERDLKLPPPTYDEVKSTIHEDDIEKFEETILLAQQSDKEQTIEFRIRMADNRIKTVESRGKVIRDEAGKAVRLFGTVMDISERKNVMEELIRARTQAEESSKAKEYFLANISHELRTPLNGIIGMARLLQKTALNSTQREYTEVLQQTAGNLMVIINDILDFAKIESGTLALEAIPFDPSRVADTAVQLQMFKAEEKDLILRHLHEGQPLPKVMGDPYRLSQILLNLLNNGIKYTNHGEVVLSHRIIEENESEVRIQFTVKDTGIGIPYDMQSEIFESFAQVTGSSRVQGGIGLGLTISKSLVERLGGRIWVESKPDVGSSFHFTIPYVKAKPESAQQTGNQLEPMDVGAVKILLVEDNKVNLFITEALLHDWGFKVDVAMNGLEAVEQCRKNDYNLVLMDIQMPEMNGIDATKAIRRIPDRKKSSVPIIAITANTSRTAHKQFLTEGMNDWVVKPFKDEALYKKIAQHISSKSFNAEAIKQRKFPQRKKPLHEISRLYDLSNLRRDDPGNPAFLKRMLTIFIDTIPGIVDTMQQHFEQGEMDAVCTLAHKIKPTLDGAGIHGLKDVIRNIEGYRDKRRTSDQLREDLDQLKRVITEVTEEFKAEIAKL
ncbi:MAG: PAS domain-containing protein [Bacteroidia bacterium]